MGTIKLTQHPVINWHLLLIIEHAEVRGHNDTAAVLAGSYRCLLGDTTWKLAQKIQCKLEVS